MTSSTREMKQDDQGVSRGQRARNGVLVIPAIDRLRRKLRLDPKTGCHEWTAALDRKGYARVSVGGHRNRLAHRVVYEADAGPIPDGLTIDHLCQNHACCNVEHLELVSAAENTRRMMACRPLSTVCRRGHEFTPDNILMNARGRTCRRCRNERDRRNYQGAKLDG